ncbi:MAG: cyclic nucleotide-binding domain-containing protein [Chloroflexi bacterium AL-W]|nr:cyclic nucleotide-binding domain-containing protein [Chloroflexi bacterium AL-N1]NOK69335.1 cyclic nucleotide-binding domain-containing protein [Chloroflexi bacterium AL-N10]NOK76396.1 cyclic nucleotide-binding domain-containing protein [Chloroflexi bacterium AL-N5]NOK83513.1 cyclic nucleotide-binding domain-containing protein [Chloroflexi bacterium AL-W]NOK91173.1 cyclic nucleotide-binding domain-containing protein [Chloroflexi bacterium AL-N15]
MSTVSATLSNEDLHRQVTLLTNLACFKEVPVSVLERVATLCTMRAFLPEALLAYEREALPFVYILIEGTVDLTLHDRAGRDIEIGPLHKGDCFGIGPLSSEIFCGMTARAQTFGYALQIRFDELRNIMAESKELTVALHDVLRRRITTSILKRVPLFSQLPSLERSSITELFQSQRFDRNEMIIQQGQPGSALYLIESGQVIVERDGQTVAHLQEGDFFGEMALLDKRSHSASIRTLTPIDILALPGESLNRLLEEQPQLAEQLRTVAEQRHATNKSMQSNQQYIQQLGHAVDRGALRGAYVLVRDTRLCEDGCRICETACATRHGHARIHASDMFINELEVMDTCRQCFFGAECVEACPEDAIQWNNDGALMITEQCTGCGDCVPACPYDAVQRVTQKTYANGGPLGSLWRNMQRLRIPLLALQPHKIEYRADKCDLCHGYDDLACVSACPTGAMKLMPVEELFPL